MANTYDVGETVVLQATFRNASGALATPGTYTLYIERTDSTTDTVAQGSLTEASTGVITYDDTAEGYGITFYRFVGVSAGRTVVEQGSYDVRKQRAATS